MQTAAKDFEGLSVMNDEPNTVGGTAAAVNGKILCGLHVQVGAV